MGLLSSAWAYEVTPVVEVASVAVVLLVVEELQSCRPDAFDHLQESDFEVKHLKEGHCLMVGQIPKMLQALAQWED
jgi:hypothetical protein